MTSVQLQPPNLVADPRRATDGRVPPDPIRVGLISDTHGLLRPEATSFLDGCDHIVHAGDIGHSGILEELRSLAPLTVVRGNNDKGAWADALRESEWLSLGALAVYVIHDISELTLDAESAGIRVVISGHSHKPSVEERGRVLYVNPGSAGPRRFNLPIAIGELWVGGRSVSARVVELKAGSAARGRMLAEYADAAPAH
jgi:putative phosphoesterase